MCKIYPNWLINKVIKGKLVYNPVILTILDQKRKRRESVEIIKLTTTSVLTQFTPKVGLEHGGIMYMNFI